MMQNVLPKSVKLTQRGEVEDIKTFRTFCHKIADFYLLQDGVMDLLDNFTMTLTVTVVVTIGTDFENKRSVIKIIQPS